MFLQGLVSSCSASASHAAASLFAERGLQGTRGSVAVAPEPYSTVGVAVAQGLHCSGACGIFLDQGLRLSPALAGRFFFFFYH